MFETIVIETKLLKVGEVVDALRQSCKLVVIEAKYS